MAFVIATVAEKGAGKGLFVKIAQKLLAPRRVAVIRFSDPLREILGILGKEESRENIDTLITALREGFHDQGVLISAMEKRMAATDADIVILDAVRKPEEASFVKTNVGVLVCIAARQEIRFERRRKKSENVDEVGMTWEQFVRQDGAPPQVSIREICETMADATIENNGTEEEFEEKVKLFLRDHELPAIS